MRALRARNTNPREIHWAKYRQNRALQRSLPAKSPVSGLWDVPAFPESDSAYPRAVRAVHDSANGPMGLAREHKNFLTPLLTPASALELNHASRTLRVT